MADYKQFLRLLEKELGLQEKILKVLTKERAAIVKLNREDIESLSEEKEVLYVRAKELETRRVQFTDKLQKDGEKLKLSDIVEACDDRFDASWTMNG